MRTKIKKTDQNLHLLINTLEENKIRYWVCHGTLLGIVRDKKLISWDHDIDICVWFKEVEKERMVELLTRDNFVYQAHLGFGNKYDQLSFDRTGGRRVDINFYEVTTLMETNNKVAFTRWGYPKNIFMKLVEAISYADVYEGKFRKIIKFFKFIQKPTTSLKKALIRYKIFYKEAGYTQPLELLKKFKVINFQGVDITIPLMAEEYLEHVYGKDWRIPKKKFSWWNDSKTLIKDYSSKA